MLVNMNQMLQDAQNKQYAVGLFNVYDTDILEGVLSAAEELRSPVIIAPVIYGDLKMIAPSLVDAAKRASVPVAVHYDHATTFEKCMESLQLGFSSVMYDGSVESMEDNIRHTAEVVKVAHAMGATVEGEIGCVGVAAKGDNAVDDLYTKVEDAVRFQKETGVDALAIAIGTAHGNYKIQPKLDFNRLQDIRAALDTPLVLHGGSGLSEDDFRNSIKYGIAKVNIFTDICNVILDAMSESEKAGENYVKMREAKIEAVRKLTVEKIKIFGSEGKYNG